MKRLALFVVVLIFAFSTTVMAAEPAAAPAKKEETAKVENAPAKKSLPIFQETRLERGKTVIAALPNCVDSGGTCVIGGTRCCNAAETCKGKFPNTTCQ